MVTSIKLCYTISKGGDDMNWFQIINETTLYIEDHIDEKIELASLASKQHISYHYFAKMFTLITGYTLKEYIRNRRITLASYDVNNTDLRIIDIAVKYGYSSNEAFTRAFKKVHGINPSSARKNKLHLYTHFPVLTYDVPKQNLVSLQYDLIENIQYQLSGQTTHIVETDYEHTHRSLNNIKNCFLNDHPSLTIDDIYQVKYNLRMDFLEYDFFVGFNTYQMDETLDNISLQIDHAVRFKCPNIERDSVPLIKKIIYKEWEKNGFISDLKCEIECLHKNKNSSYDFYYIVSIEKPR